MASPSILAFSTTPANNASGVTGVNFAEGQAPSTLNDSMRSLMSRLAYWRDMLAGNITQGGSSNAYTATTGESLTAYTNGLRLLWKPNATSSGAVTLNVDSIGAKKVYRPDGTQAGSGDILSGTLLDVVYLSTLDSAAGGFQIVGGINEATAISMSGQYKLLGRATAGAGLSEEIASSADVFTLLGGANFAALRTSLSLVPGTDVFKQRTITAPAAGITVSNGDGVSGNPTLALANDLAAYEGLAATGLVARTGDGSAAARTLTAPAAGITVSNGDGVAGNPTLALGNDLAAYEGLSSTGLVVRSGDGTATTRSVTGTANEITVTNGDGVSGAPILSLPTALTFTGKTVTGGTFSGPTLSSPTFSGVVAGNIATTGYVVGESGVYAYYNTGVAVVGFDNDLSGSFYETAIFAGGVSDAVGRISFGRRRADTGTYTERVVMDVATGDVTIPASPTVLSTNSVGFRGAPLNNQPNSYTFVLADAGNLVQHNSASAHNFTIPPNSSVAFPLGTIIPILNPNGAGVLTILEGAGVTLRRADAVAGSGSRTVAADSQVAIEKTSTNEWYITGPFT